MSDVFKNIDYGNQAQDALARLQSTQAKVAAERAKRNQKGTIEENVGLLKASLGFQKLTEGALKGAKPYLKQQTNKALNSVKDSAQKFADRITNKTQKAVDKATKTRDDLQKEHDANEGVRAEDEANAQTKVEQAAADSLKDGATDEEAFQATKGAVSEQIETNAANDGVRAQEATEMSSANDAIDTAKAGGQVGDSVASKAAGEATETVAKDAAKAAGKTAAKDASEEVGGEVATEITGTEALGAALDSTGIGAPVGILLGLLGIGLGARQEAEKHQPKMPPQPLNESGATFQAGIN